MLCPKFRKRPATAKHRIYHHRYYLCAKPTPVIYGTLNQVYVRLSSSIPKCAKLELREHSDCVDDKQGVSMKTWEESKTG